MARVRVLLADDHPPLLAAVRRLLGSEFEVVGEAHTGEEAIQLARDLRPDVVLTDLAMPRKGGLEAVRQITKERSAAAVVVLTVLADPAVRDAAMQAGARAYVIKARAGVELVPAISAAFDLAANPSAGALRGARNGELPGS